MPELGFYAEKQLACSDPIIAWSHRRRFETALQLVEGVNRGALLDYGCGDGTFVEAVAPRFLRVVGSELLQSTLDDCQARSVAKNVEFVLQSQMLRASSEQFDAITCMEVIEHCGDQAATQILDEMTRLLKPSGRIVISVPVEIGPSLLIKETLRTLAGLRRLGDYAFKERYTRAELWTMFRADANTRFERTPIHPEEGVYGHKGFNWRALHQTLKQRFLVERVRFSPLPLSSSVASQVWFVCAKR
ncbi:MAG: class I SAM-dependent methyltransferase [Myxococcaceae bacterium]